jgi:hypothetical protein
MLKFIIRTAIGLALTFCLWYWYNENVLSHLDIEGQLAEYEFDYDPDDYEDDSDYAYDDYDTESDW